MKNVFPHLCRSNMLAIRSFMLLSSVDYASLVTDYSEFVAKIQTLRCKRVVYIAPPSKIAIDQYSS